MARTDRWWLVRALAILLLAAAVTPGGDRPPSVAEVAEPESAASVSRPGLALPFEANVGQWDAPVAFGTPVAGGVLFVTRDGVLVHALTPGRDRDGGIPDRVRGWTVVETLVDADPRPRAGVPSRTGISRFVGNDPSRWQPRIPACDEVSLGEAWPGIDVSLRKRGRTVERVFRIAPGADVGAIRVRLEGIDGLRRDEDGALRTSTGLGDLRLSPPVAWQEGETGREPVAAAYAPDGAEFGFALGQHDPARAVFIDPLIQSTFLGGSANDRGLAMDVWPISREVYVTGTTWSVDFPGTTGGIQEDHAGGGVNQDVLVARLSSDLKTLLQATYLGGVGDSPGLAGHEEGLDIVIRSADDVVYVAGWTTSDVLPRSDLGSQPSRAGGADGFVIRMSRDLTSVTFSSFLGGGQDDIVTAVEYSGPWDGVFVTGRTRSVDLPGIRTGSARTSHSGGTWDAFVSRFDRFLLTTRSTYLGGSEDDQGHDLALHANGDVYVVGETRSPYLPEMVGAAQFFHAGYVDGFVARLSMDLETIHRTTFLGGLEEDVATCVEYYAHSLHVGGTTSSYRIEGRAGGRFWGLGGRDGFLAWYNVRDDPLREAPVVTYVGGSGNDHVTDLSRNEGPLLVVGYTTSADLLAREGGARPTYSGTQDAFVALVHPQHYAVIQSTYLGATGGEMAYAVEDYGDDLYVAGLTSSPDFPGTAGGAQPVHGGGQDVFVTLLDRDLRGPDAPEPTCAIAKGKIKLRTSGWQVKLKKGTFSTGASGYVGNGEDLRIFVDGTEVAPPGSRTVKAKSKKITIKSTSGPKCSFKIKIASGKTKLTVKGLPEPSVDPSDGVTIRVELLGREAEVTAATDVKGKKLLPAVGTMD